MTHQSTNQSGYCLALSLQSKMHLDGDNHDDGEKVDVDDDAVVVDDNDDEIVSMILALFDFAFCIIFRFFNLSFTFGYIERKRLHVYVKSQRETTRLHRLALLFIEDLERMCKIVTGPVNVVNVKKL